MDLKNRLTINEKLAILAAIETTIDDIELSAKENALGIFGTGMLGFVVTLKSARRKFLAEYPRIGNSIVLLTKPGKEK